MYFIVAPIAQGNTPGGGLHLDRKDSINFVYSDKAAAMLDAREKAKMKPGTQYGVFSLSDIAEAKATLVNKKIDENGQIVVAS